MELKGKKIAILGDSITEGIGVYDQANRYDNVLLREYELSWVQNLSISGSRLAHQSAPSPKPHYDLCFCGRAYALDTSADICVVWGGVNDFFHGDAYIGSPEDTTPATFQGALNFLITLLKEMFKDKPIVFMTPARNKLRGTTDEIVSPRPIKKHDAMPLIGYADLIVEAGKRHGIYVLDLFRDFPINPNIPEDYEKYTRDGLHLNDEGHILLAKTLGEFLERI